MDKNPEIENRISGASDLWDDQLAGQILTNSYFNIITSITGYIKVYLSGMWQLKPIKVWNGSAWVIKPLKWFNGSTWNETN